MSPSLKGCESLERHQQTSDFRGFDYDRVGTELHRRTRGHGCTDGNFSDRGNAVRTAKVSARSLGLVLELGR